MSIFSKVNKALKDYKAGEEERENKKLAHARTVEARAKLRADIEKDRLKRKKEVAEARAATLRAEVASKKAKLELRQVGKGSSSGFTTVMRKLANQIHGTPVKKRRSVSHRRKKTNSRRMIMRG